MGTRPGALDPGVVLYLIQTLGLAAKDVETILYKKSGLLGISGISNDMRDLLESAEPAARLAVDYFVYRAAKEIGALAAALGGIDGLVFTAGIGENSAEIRRRIGEACAWLGVGIDPAANAGKGPRISRAGSRVSAWVIPTNEELMIARHTGRLLGISGARAERAEAAMRADDGQYSFDVSAGGCGISGRGPLCLLTPREGALDLLFFACRSCPLAGCPPTSST